MVSTPKAPTPPDPAAQAAAQTGTNLATAQANASMNNINQVTPYGNLTYSQTGHNFISDPNGQQYYTDGQGHYQTSLPGGGSPATAGTPGTPGHYVTGHGGHGDTYQEWVPGTAATAASGGGIPAGWTSVKGEYVPNYTATQTLSPQQQAILDQTQAAQLNLGTLANRQSAAISDMLAKPVDLSQENLDNYTNTHWMGGFNNQWDRDQKSLDQKLADQGIQSGTEAYSNATRDFSNNKQAGLDQYLGSMYGQAQSSILAERDQPLNEMAALLSGSQVTQPNYASGTPSSAIPTVDVAGLQQQQFSNQYQNYNSAMQSHDATMAGLFGLGSAALGGWAKSDRRLKDDIKRVGTLDNGLPVYSFRYKDGGPIQIGLMSDDVAETQPDAVYRHSDGFDRVNYEQAVI